MDPLERYLVEREERLQGLLCGLLGVETDRIGGWVFEQKRLPRRDEIVVRLSQPLQGQLSALVAHRRLGLRGTRW